MYWLVVAESGLMTLPRSFALLHKYFCHRPPLHVLDLVANSANSVFLEWMCFNCAEGSCDLNVLSCDMCNTQLRVDLSVFLPSLVGGILLMGHIRCFSLLPDLSLRSLQYVRMFVRLMCPLCLGLSASFEASILVDEMWSFLLGAL